MSEENNLESLKFLEKQLNSLISHESNPNIILISNIKNRNSQIQKCNSQVYKESLEALSDKFDIKSVYCLDISFNNLSLLNNIIKDFLGNGVSRGKCRNKGNAFQI